MSVEDRSQKNVNEKSEETRPDKSKMLKINGLLRWGGLGAALLYLIFTLLLGASRMGLHYDEAIVEHGAVHMLNSANEPSFAHDEASWIPFAGRYWPLVVIPYAGAVKDYILLLPFALFGTSVGVSRAVNALLGAFGIWGIAKLLRHEINVRIAAAAGFIIAIHPAYLDQTLFDSGVVVVWMAVLGLISVTILNYKKRRSSPAAFLIGLAMGIGVWNRVNFIWFLGSALMAALFVFRRRLLIPMRHITALICGSMIGVFPMVLFQILSRLKILGFIRWLRSEESFGPLLARRLRMLSETLISDGDMKTIWGGPPLPLWQVYFFPLLLIAALIACFMLKQDSNERVILWKRASALTFIIYALVMLSSRLKIEHHHLVTLVPIATVFVVLGFQGLIQRWKRAEILVMAFALVYAGSALYWNVATARGLWETGGVDAWSNGIYAVKDYLASNYSGQEIKILDWALQDNLYVLSNAKINSSEIFWGASLERAGSGAPWSALIARGGVYLTHSGENRYFPEATQGFLAALYASGQPFNRKEFSQKQGRGYAELYDISPLPKYKSTDIRTTAKGTVTASPNPIVACGGAGVTTISWNSSAAKKIEVHIGSPDGELFAVAECSGSWPTGNWVSNGTTFYLQDVSDGRPLTSENTIATVTVKVTNAGCP